MANIKASKGPEITAQAMQIEIPGANYALEIVPVFAKLHKGFADLSREDPDLKLITGEQLALARVHGGSKYLESPLSRHSTFVDAYGVYLNDDDIMIATGKHNLMLKRLEDVAAAHGKGLEFYLNTKEVRELMKVASPDPGDARKSGVLLLNRNSVPEKIPYNALEQLALTNFLLGDAAKDYGYWCNKQGVTEIPVHLFPATCVNKQQGDINPRPFALDIHIWGTKGKSLIESYQLSGVEGWVVGTREIKRGR